MLRQTRFLVAMFRAYEQRVSLTGRLDEHGLRALVLDRGLRRPLCQVVVTVADRAAGADGLWSGDFDLLARLPNLARIDLVATASMLDTGFRERLQDLLPGVEETRVEPSAPATARLVTPTEPSGGRYFTFRDREEELLAVIRQVKHRSTRERTAVVFQRPLPYLYLAPQLFASAGVPFETRDTLPLAAEPSVSVAPFRSEADDDKRLRDREETKRLLYVATTRARDRLYLSATLGEGVVKVGPGSFASVLPPSLLAQLSAAPLDADRLSWSGFGGGAHTFALVGPGVATSGSRFSRGGSTETAGDRLLGWRPTGGPPRVQVPQIAAAMPAGVAPDRAAGADPVVGRLVHRMLQRDGEAAGMVPAAPDAAARAIELMTGEERARHDHHHVASEAAAIYVRALAQPDVATLLGGDCLFKVPFSMRRDDVDPERGVVIVRGTIECLRRWSDGRLTVFELKTGRVRSHHERQLALYVDAARALFPDAAVDGKVIYL